MANATDSRSRLWRRGLWTCVGVAAVARVALCAYAWQHPARFDYPDSRRYVAVAQNIAAGRGPAESDAIRCGTDPGYPYLLSLAPLAGVKSFEAVMNWGRIVNSALGLAAIVAAMTLARRAAGEIAAIAAGLMMAVDPIFLFFHGLVLTEVAYACPLLWGLVWLLRSVDDRSVGFAALSGAVLAAGALVRSGGIVMPLLLVPVFLAIRPGRTAWATATAFCVAFVVVMTPMAVRNYRILGAIVPIRTMGPTLLDSFGPWADGATGMQRIAWPQCPPDATEYERERIYRRTALGWARENPLKSVQLAGAKLLRTWSITLHAPGYQGGIFDLIAWLTVTPVFVLAAVGAWLLRSRRVLLYTLLTPAILTSILHCVFVGSVRYRIPAMPGLFVLAGTAIAALAARRSTTSADGRVTE